MLNSYIYKILFYIALSLFESKHYEESYPIFNITKSFNIKEPEYIISYYQCICCHQIINKLDAIKYADEVLDSFYTVPKRYIVMVSLIKNDVLSWRDKDLDKVNRKMNDVVNRLDGYKAGKVTQVKQADLLKDLDKMIKDLEDAEKKAKEDADIAASSAKGQSNKAAPQSELPNDGPNEGKILDAELKEAAKNWGTLPDLERAKIVQRLTTQMPPKYKAFIEEYFKALSRSEK